MTTDDASIRPQDEDDRAIAIDNAFEATRAAAKAALDTAGTDAEMADADAELAAAYDRRRRLCRL
jgi:hypothetical protein